MATHVLVQSSLENLETIKFKRQISIYCLFAHAQYPLSSLRSTFIFPNRRKELLAYAQHLQTLSSFVKPSSQSSQRSILICIYLASALFSAFNDYLARSRKENLRRCPKSLCFRQTVLSKPLKEFVLICTCEAHASHDASTIVVLKPKEVTAES